MNQLRHHIIRGRPGTEGAGLPLIGSGGSRAAIAVRRRLLVHPAVQPRWRSPPRCGLPSARAATCISWRCCGLQAADAGSSWFRGRPRPATARCRAWRLRDCPSRRARSRPRCPGPMAGSALRGRCRTDGESRSAMAWPISRRVSVLRRSRLRAGRALDAALDIAELATQLARTHHHDEWRQQLHGSSLGAGIPRHAAPRRSGEHSRAAAAHLRLERHKMTRDVSFARSTVTLGVSCWPSRWPTFTACWAAGRRVRPRPRAAARSRWSPC